MPTETPQQALDRRLAQGEISLEEYERLKATAAESGNSGRVARPPLTVSWSQVVRKRQFPLIAALVLALAHFCAVTWMWHDYYADAMAYVDQNVTKDADNLPNVDDLLTKMRSPDFPQPPALAMALGFPIVYLSIADNGGYKTGELAAQSALWGLIGFVVIRRFTRKVVNRDA